MYKTITSVVAIVLCLLDPVLAQNPASQFGVISQSEINLTEYNKDPKAEAVVLFDVGEVYFFDVDNGGYEIRFTRTKRIKILSRAGINHAEVSIPYYVDGFGKTEKVASIEAYSYNVENGISVKKALDQNNVYETKINERWRTKKFVFPDVKEGSIIEYKYVLETPFHFNLPDWQFQDRIPTIYSQYTAKLIPFYEYVFVAQGIKKFDFHESKLDKVERRWGSGGKVYGQLVGNGIEFKDMIYTFVLKDVPALNDEAFITSPADYLIKLDFQLARVHLSNGTKIEIITTWPELTKQLLKHQTFGKYINGAERLAKKLLETEIKLEQKSDIEKSKQIIEYVKENFNWNGYYSKNASKSPKEFLTQKTGNSADINLFLTALLNTAGVKAHPVILSTRDHEKIKGDYPFEHFFNYVIVLVEGEKQAFLTDATEGHIAYSRIPPRCMNEKGLVVKDSEETWVELHNKVQSLDTKNINISINAQSLKAKAAVVVLSTEFEALGYRSLFSNDTIKIKEALLNNGFTNVFRVKTLNYERAGLPYTIAYDGETAIEKIDNKIVVSPFLHFPIQQNKLTQAKRSYPVDFIYSKKEVFKSLIDVPAGYKVVGLPEDFVMNDELAEISLSCKVVGTTIEATASYHFKKGIYGTEEYARLKTHMETIVKKFNEQVVFEEI